MKILIAFFFLFSGSAVFAAPALPKTENILRTLLSNFPPVQVLKGSLLGAPEKSCTVLVTHRNGLVLSDYRDKSVDLSFFVENKIEGAIHLAEQLVPFAIAYEAELDVDVISDSEVRIFTSIGHFTDQYIGYNSFEWVLKRLSNETLHVILNTGWADDDGGSGGADFTCVIQNKISN